MNAQILAMSLSIGLVLSSMAGPWVLRRGAPALMRLPRLAIGVLLGSVLAWLLAVLALGPVLAWVVSGPAVLPGGAGEVCQQCLAAASPFTAGPLIDTAVPVVLLLALPALAAGLHSLSIIGDTRRRRRSTLRTAHLLRARSELRRLHGQDVLVADDPHPFALTLPHQHGGIVISSGAVDLLSPDELAAVLAHERAHLRQRHHLLSGIVTDLTRRLRWVPLLAAADDALHHYLEIAADDAARRHVGTTALASALLRLGRSGHPDLHDGAPLAGALHALGPDRIRHLVQPSTGTAGAVSAAVGTLCLVMLAVLAALVHVPYALTVLTGCL